ncbi:MAG: hypothetical protein Q9191_000138, partial [Dirinaria sp. TL-2023a]
RIINALHVAADAGNLIMISRLLQEKVFMTEISRYCDVFDIPATELGKIIVYAARERHLAVVDRLLRHGGGKPLKDGALDAGLGAAARNEHLAMIERLLHSGDSMTQQSQLTIAFTRAADAGQLFIIERLLQLGANVNRPYLGLPSESSDLTDISGLRSRSQYALYYAARGGHKSVLDYLVRTGATIDALNVVDGDRVTTLYGVASDGHIAVIKILLKNDADVSSDCFVKYDQVDQQRTGFVRHSITLYKAVHQQVKGDKDKNPDFLFVLKLLKDAASARKRDT